MDNCSLTRLKVHKTKTTLYIPFFPALIGKNDPNC